MKPIQWIFLALVVALVGGFAYFQSSRSAVDGDSNLERGNAGLTVEESTRAADLTGTDVPDTQAGAAAEPSLPEATRQAIADGARLVRALVSLPEGAAQEAGLRVVAAPKAGIGRGKGLDKLDLIRQGKEVDFDWVAATVDADGVAQLAIPEGMKEPVLLVDGLFTVLPKPIELQKGAGEIALKADYGACITVDLLDLPQEVTSGTLRFTGYQSNGGSRFTTVEGALFQREFRGLPDDLVWMLQVEMDEHYSPGKMGMRVRAGEVLPIQVPVQPGSWIEGVVRNEQGEPLEGIDVKIPSPIPWMNFAGPGSAAETGEDGTYALGPLSPGVKTIEAQKKGHVLVETPDVTLAIGERLSGVDLTLGLGMRISGRVLWPDGQPVAKANVTAETRTPVQEGGPWGGSGREVVGRVKTDKEGAFEITGLEAGKVAIKASKRGKGSTGAGATFRAELGAVAAGTQGLDIRLESPLPLLGRVVDDLGQPVTKFTIIGKSVEDGGATERMQFEDGEGRFAFERLGQGTWRIEAKAKGLEQVQYVEAELPRLEGDLTLTLARQTSVSGRVLDPEGNPVVAAKVMAVEGSNASWAWGFQNGPNAKTDLEGHFVIGEMSPGAWSLSATADGWADSAQEVIEVEAGSTREGLVLHMRRGGRIVGVVDGPDGRPSSGHRVMWGLNSMGWTSNGETLTDGAGRFAFDTITPGEWMVTATASLEELGNRMRDARTVEDFSVMMSDMLTQTVVVVEGETVEVRLGADPVVPIRVQGRVVQGSKPVGSAQVYAVSEGQAIMQGMKSASSSEDGTYELTVDRPGAYIISATKGTIGVETFVDVPQSESFSHDLRIPGGTIQGHVKLPNGDPAPGIVMGLERQDGLGNVRWNGANANTDVEGYYQFDSVEAGAYTVRVNTASWTKTQNEAFASEAAAGLRVGKDASVRQDFKLKKPGSIEGIVVDSAGQPVAGVTIFVRDGGGNQISTVSTTMTNAAGKFARAGLAAGSYTLSARSETGASSESESIRVQVGQASTTRLRIVPGTFLIVTLHGEEDELERLKVEVFDRDDHEMGRMWTLKELMNIFGEGASTTEQRLGPFAPGSYRVRATTRDGRSKEMSVNISPGTDEKRLKIKL